MTNDTVKYLFMFYYHSMSSSSSSSSSGETELTDTAYDILKVLGKDADFIYDTIETYIKDAQKANKTKLVEIWQTIKKDRKRHMHMLKEALEEEIHG
jgi:rubrerythrin